MAVSTNLGLYLPTREDYISVKRDLSDNYEIIDESSGMLEKGIAIVVNGDTAPRAISSGDYLFIKNHSTLATGGYHATANIANGAAVTSSNTASDSKGVTNTIKGDIDSINSNITSLSSDISIQKNKDWRQVPINSTKVFYYGTAGEETTYSLPSSACYVISCRSAESRGFAICIAWANTSNNGYWICHLHDDASPYEWSQWVKISVDTALSSNIKIAENGTFDIPIGNYGSAIITGYVGNVGSVIIAVQRNASTLVAKNMITGSDWSSTYLSFSTVTAGIRITNSNTQRALLSIMYDGSSRL